MTITTAAPVDTELEDWRDTMINLAVSAYHEAYFNPGPIFRIQSEDLAIVANSLSDIRVRDVLIWHISNLSPDGVIVARTAFTKMWDVGCQTAHVAASIATVSLIAGDKSDALAWSVVALGLQAQHGLASLVLMTLSTGLPCDSLVSALADLTYEQTRYGS